MNQIPGLLFASLWAVRLLYVLLFIIVCWMHTNITSGRNEVILGVERVNYFSQRNSNLVDITIETQSGKITTESGEKRLAKFKPGDTISIFYNYFDKPVYVSRPNSQWAFPLVDHLMGYGIIMFATLLSLPMKGKDKFEKYFMWAVWYVDIGTIGIYFLV